MIRTMTTVLLLATVDTQIDFALVPEPLRSAINSKMKVLREINQVNIGSSSTSQHVLREAMKQQKVQEAINETVAFSCDVTEGRSPQVPSSVHRLRPGDIDVIGAMGDSLTAGFGAFAQSFRQVFKENRGVTSLIGGQGSWREFLTIPNILKNFNPNLIGYSLGDSPSWVWRSQFNVAEGGAVTSEMPFMAQEIINRLKNDSRVDIEQHWKLISILIGGNDFCIDMCYFDENKYMKKRQQNLMQALDLLRDNLPRTLVNLVLAPDVGRLMSEFQGSTRCWVFQRLECPCVLGSRFADKQHYYRPLITEALKMDYDIGYLKRYDREDFTVVVQPLLANLTLPKLSNGETDPRIMSFDCFHLSQRGQALLSKALWNNMAEPVGKKSSKFASIDDQLKCYSREEPFIFTRRNSV